MTAISRALTVIVVLVVSAIPAAGADATGSWTSSFDTPVGPMNYTYTLKVDGTTVTGTAKSDTGQTEIQGGKVDGDKIIFVENLDFGGMTIVITYTGTFVNDDEIKFSRVIGDFGTDEIVAKRVK